MTGFRHVGLISTGLARNLTDLSLGSTGSRLVLAGVTHVGGGLSLWNVAAPDQLATLVAARAYPDVLRHGSEPRAVLLDRPGGLTVMPGGLWRGSDYVRGIGAEGGSWVPDNPAVAAPLPVNLLDAGSVKTWQGQSLIFATQAAQPVFTLWRSAPDGTLVRTGVSAPPPGVPAGAQIDSVTHLRIGAVDLLLSSSIRGNFISAHRILPDGSLAAGEFYSAARGAGFNGPRHVSAVVVEGHPFVIVASAGSSSLTTIRVLPNGALVPVDHVLDERTTRFDSATVMETAVVGGRAFVVVGGADDGLSLFTVAPDGRLIHLDTFVDGPWTALANVSALAVRAIGNQLAVFAASATEAGVSQLVVPLGPIGVTRHVREGAHAGTEANDLIQGGVGTTLIEGRGGDDILIAGGGASAMAGGSGADVFIPTADTTRLVVRDFEVGVDRLDLSMMGMVRSPAQVTFVAMSWGLRLKMGDRVIELRSADGRPISAASIAASLFPVAHYQPPDVRATVVGTGRAEVLAATRGGATVLAWAGNDTVIGSNLEDRLLGAHGNDMIFGNDGDDTLWGGSGMDYLRGGGMNDLIYGGYDNDVIVGDDGDDLLVGEDANDFLVGGAGTDTLNGGWGNDSLLGGAGNDMIYGWYGNDRLDGGDGDDYMVDPLGDNLFHASSGRNKMIGGTGRDRMFGGTGNDLMRAGANADLCYGAAGNDDIDGGPGADTLVGNGGNDLLNGGWGNDRVYGGIGNDTVIGGGGDDWLVGHAGDDFLVGGPGADSLIAWEGNDRLRGDDGNDILVGNEGDDTLDGGDGDDRLEGQAGDDFLVGGAGRDRLVGWQGDDLLHGGADADMLYGNPGNDTLHGGDGRDQLWGGLDDDLLNGGADADTLMGMAGDDRLNGGAGQDQLTGDAGCDVFVFAAPSDSAVGAEDRITDFISGEDLIDLSAMQLHAIGAAAFSGTEGELRWFRRSAGGDSWRIEADRDGDGVADLAVLVTAPAGLDASDFLL